jgi:hypothetical protein
MSEHRTIVFEESEEDGLPVYFYSCACGMGGVPWHVLPNAEQDAARHKQRHTEAADPTARQDEA